MAIELEWHEQSGINYLCKNKDVTVSLNNVVEHNGRRAHIHLVYATTLMDAECKCYQNTTLEGKDFDKGKIIEEGTASFCIRVSTLSSEHYKDCYFKFKIIPDHDPTDIFYSDEFKVYSKTNRKIQRKRPRKQEDAFKVATGDHNKEQETISELATADHKRQENISEVDTADYLDLDLFNFDQPNNDDKLASIEQTLMRIERKHDQTLAAMTLLFSHTACKDFHGACGK